MTIGVIKGWLLFKIIVWAPFLFSISERRRTLIEFYNLGSIIFFFYEKEKSLEHYSKQSKCVGKLSLIQLMREYGFNLVMLWMFWIMFCLIAMHQYELIYILIHWNFLCHHFHESSRMLIRVHGLNLFCFWWCFHLWSKNTLGCHNFSKLKSLFKVLF